MQSETQFSLWNWEGRIETIDGDSKWINIRATPRRQNDDSCIWDGVAINVSEDKLYEEEILHTQQALRELSAHLEDVREQERKHMAREIHDELGQSLTALRMDISLARLGFGESNPKLMERLQSMTRLVDHTIGITRDVTSSLRPAALDLGIGAALEWLVAEFNDHYDIACDLSLMDGEIELDDAAVTAVFRVVQESLTNIARHAGASRVEIAMSRNEDMYCIEVRDDGRGFDPRTRRTRSSHGLIGMRERMAMLQGEVIIESETGHGTCVRVFVPPTRHEHV